MLNLIPYFSVIIATLAIIAVLVFKGRKHRKMQEDIKRRFLDEEAAANAVRKKDIAPELFYTAELSKLPPLAEGDPHNVERCARRKMIRFEKPTTNLELKMQYGLAQMDSIALYEENFNEYLKALTSWAEALAEENESDALAVLEHAVSLGSEFRGTYKLAADLYAKSRNAAKLQVLRECALKNHFKDEAIRRHILEYIDICSNRYSHFS